MNLSTLSSSPEAPTSDPRESRKMKPGAVGSRNASSVSCAPHEPLYPFPGQDAGNYVILPHIDAQEGHLHMLGNFRDCNESLKTPRLNLLRTSCPAANSFRLVRTTGSRR